MGSKERYHKARTGVLVGVIGNLFLAMIKLAAGIFFFSTAVVADSIHSLSDMLSSIVVWAGIRIGRIPPDRSHPYGHGDAEPLAGLLVAMLLGILGFEFVRQSFFVLVSGNPQVPGRTAVLVVAFAIIVKYWMARFVSGISSSINSSALEADASHHKADAYTSIGVLAGVIGARFGFPLLDPLVGMAISLYVIKLGFDMGRKNIRSLMGEAPSVGMSRKIKEIACGAKGVKGVHDIKIHYVGPNAFVTMHINMDKNQTLSKAHGIATRIEEKVKKEMDSVSNVMVHPEPA